MSEVTIKQDSASAGKSSGWRMVLGGTAVLALGLAAWSEFDRQALEPVPAAQARAEPLTAGTAHAMAVRALQEVEATTAAASQAARTGQSLEPMYPRIAKLHDGWFVPNTSDADRKLLGNYPNCGAMLGAMRSYLNGSTGDATIRDAAKHQRLCTEQIAKREVK